MTTQIDQKLLKVFRAIFEPGDSKLAQSAKVLAARHAS